MILGRILEPATYWLVVLLINCAAEDLSALQSI